MEEIELKENEILLLEGPLTLEIKEGEVTISGGLHEKGEKITIPRAKSIPLETSTKSLVSYEKGEEGNVEKLSERTIPQSWDPVIDEIIEENPDTVIVLGEMDTGKTFFSTYMANRLLNEGITPSIVDTDPGQSDIGPPGSIGMGTFKSHVALLSEIPTLNSYFIGSMSPSGHMLEFLVGVKKMAEAGLEETDQVIVDTPGWVTQGPGRSLQQYGAEILDPGFVIGLQRENELEHLLKTLPGKIRRVEVSGKVRKRVGKERMILRKKSLRRYFEDSEELSLDLDKIVLERSYLGTGKKINPEDLNIEKIIYAEKIPEGIVVVPKTDLSEEELRQLDQESEKVNVINPGAEEKVFVSLIDKERNLLGVGCIEEIDYSAGKIKITTPVKEESKVDRVQIGSMKIEPSGKEVGTVRPGTF